MATILIVDDRSSNREYLTTLLGYVGHRLLEATSAAEALAHVRAERPDLVIADIVMPEVDGFEFVRRLRADPSIAQTRVMFYTATYLEGEARSLAQSCGVSHILVKPAEPQMIIDTVRDAIAVDVPISSPPAAELFDREHSRLLLDKLTQKVDELEAINAELDQLVEIRTAELAAANAHLQQLNHLKDEMLVIASHDMRSPLSAILLMSEILLEEGDTASAAQQSHFLKHINAASHHLLGLISDLLDLAKIESGQLELERSELYISDLVRRAIEAMNFNALAKGIDMQVIVAPNEPLVHADRLKLSQVLHNLLSNAVKFTPEGGRVIVTVEPESEGVQLSVADSGLGMTPEDLQHVFEKFKRAHLQGTAGEKGTGLGLAIVQQLVQLHGGSVEVASEIGQGSTFTVHLPQAMLSRHYG
jgi:signal transduction histidine kinase